MVTPEERITRLEAIQEANTQQLALVLSRLDQAINLIEAVRQEVREMNEATRQEAREEIRALRQETHQLVDSVRRDSRNLFIVALSIGAALAAGLGGGIIALNLRVLERLPA